MWPTKGLAPGSTGGSWAFDFVVLLSDMGICLAEVLESAERDYSRNDSAKTLDILSGYPHYEGELGIFTIPRLLWG